MVSKIGLKTEFEFREFILKTFSLKHLDWINVFLCLFLNYVYVHSFNNSFSKIKNTEKTKREGFI